MEQPPRHAAGSFPLPGDPEGLIRLPRRSNGFSREPQETRHGFKASEWDGFEGPLPSRGLFDPEEDPEPVTQPTPRRGVFRGADDDSTEDARPPAHAYADEDSADPTPRRQFAETPTHAYTGDDWPEKEPTPRHALPALDDGSEADAEAPQPEPHDKQDEQRPFPTPLTEQPATGRRVTFPAPSWRAKPRLVISATVIGAMALAAITPASLAWVDPAETNAVAPQPAPTVSLEPVAPTEEPLPPRPIAEPAPIQAMPEAKKVKLPEPVTGIPQPCPVDLQFPASGDLGATVERMEHQWGLTLTGPQWREEKYRPVVKLFSETMDAIDCTDYLQRVKAGNGGGLEVSSESTHSWAWGDYGLTKTNTLTLDFEKFRQGYAAGDRGRLVRLIVHEMAHSLNSDRFSNPPYWQQAQGLYAKHPVSKYGSRNATESFADAVGYYVARCAAENPYATTRNNDYYDLVKREIFGGKEFGSEPGSRQICEGEGV